MEECFLEKVSVILTLYNEGKGIHRVLDYLSKNRSLFQEVIAVSDQCRDKTDSIVREWMNNASGFKRVFIQRTDRLGRADAIREALRVSSNDLNVIFAGDIKPFIGSFNNLLSYFDDETVGGVTGHPILLNELRSICDYLTLLMWRSHDQVGRMQTKNGDFFHLNGEMFAIRKSALRGFKNYMGIAEDAAIGLIIKRNGYKVLWVEDVKYYMRYPSSVSGWIQVRKRCCFGRIDLWKKYDAQDYAYYELSHPEYLINILKCCEKSIKGILSLIFGSALEVLIRLYYAQTYYRKRELFDELWIPAEETKW